MLSDVTLLPSKCSERNHMLSMCTLSWCFNDVATQTGRISRDNGKNSTGNRIQLISAD